MKVKRKAAKDTPRPQGRAGALRQYTPPIAWERFAHMITALGKHTEGLDHQRTFTGSFQSGRLRLHELGEMLDEETAKEIADALYRLRKFYSEEALRVLITGKRVSAPDLQDAANAAALVDMYHADPADAMIAVTGNPRHVERKSLAKTLKNRRVWLEKIPTDMQWNKVQAARKKLPKREG